MPSPKTTNSASARWTRCSQHSASNTVSPACTHSSRSRGPRSAERFLSFSTVWTWHSTLPRPRFLGRTSQPFSAVCSEPTGEPRERVTKRVTIDTDNGGRQRTSTDSPSQATPATALVVSTGIWLRDEEAGSSNLPTPTQVTLHGGTWPFPMPYSSKVQQRPRVKLPAPAGHQARPGILRLDAVPQPVRAPRRARLVPQRLGQPGGVGSLRVGVGPVALADPLGEVLRQVADAPRGVFGSGEYALGVEPDPNRATCHGSSSGPMASRAWSQVGRTSPVTGSR